MKTTNPKDFLELLGVFSIALTNGLLDRDEVIKWADNIITKDSEPDFFIIELSLCGHKSQSFLYGLEEDYDCAEGGIYGTIEKVEKETLRFLEIYKDFQIDNFKAWKLIDATIDEKIRVLMDIPEHTDPPNRRQKTTKISIV